jgi:uncharacterized protein YkwD
LTTCIIEDNNLKESSKGRFIVELLINNEDARKKLMNPKLKEVGIAISKAEGDSNDRKKVFMMLIADDDDFVDETEAAKYETE